MPSSPRSSVKERFGELRADARFALRTLAKNPRVHRRRDSDARARDRREQRDLQRRQRRPAQAARLSASRAARSRVAGRGREGSVESRHGLRGEPRRLARAAPTCSPTSAATSTSRGMSGTDLTGIGEPQRISATFVSPGFWNTLGVAPEVGRVPRDDEMVRGANDRLVVLSARISGSASSAARRRSSAGASRSAANRTRSSA